MVAEDCPERFLQRVEELNLSDAEVCRRAGLEGTSIADIRRGVRPSVDRAAMLARAVNWSLNELYYGTKEPTIDAPNETRVGLTLGQRIRNARAVRDMSVAELARRLDVSRPTVDAWENDVHPPRRDKVQKLANVLGPLSTLTAMARPQGAREKP